MSKQSNIFFEDLNNICIKLYIHLQSLLPWFPYIIEPYHDKTNKMSVRPVKTQISLVIRQVW